MTKSTPPAPTKLTRPTKFKTNHSKARRRKREIHRDLISKTKSGWMAGRHAGEPAINPLIKHRNHLSLLTHPLPHFLATKKLWLSLCTPPSSSFLTPPFMGKEEREKYNIG
jgi:hypothetical protein